MPETLLVLLVGVSLAAAISNRQRLAHRLLAVALFSLLFIGFVPVDKWALYDLEHAYPANPPLKDIRGIIVLGGGLDADTSLRWRQPLLSDAGDRYVAALRLARRFPQAQIFLVGGASDLDGKGVKEAVMARALFRLFGVAEDRLILETGSRNTAENAHLAKAGVIGSKSRGWVLVTSAFHMRRAMQSFCAAGWRGLIAYPTDYRTGSATDALNWALSEHLNGLALAMKERVGLAVYRLNGNAVTCPT